MSKLITKLFLIIMTLNVALAANIEGGSLMKLKQPLSDLKIDVSGCTYNILLNGVSIYEDNEGLPLSVDIPVNEWMHPNENTLSMKLGPVKDAHQLAENGDKCSASVELAVRENGQPKSDGIVISKLAYESAANHLVERKLQTEGSTPEGRYNLEHGKLVKSDTGVIQQEPVAIKLSKAPLGPGVTVSREVKTQLNYPKWVWIDGEMIPDNAETKAEIVKFYEQLFGYIKTKNMKALEELFKVRTKLLREAFYLPKNSQTTFESLKESINDPELTLVPLHPKYYTLKIFADGKLAKLYYGSINIPLLSFDNDKLNSHVSYEIILAKIKGEWVIVG